MRDDKDFRPQFVIGVWVIPVINAVRGQTVQSAQQSDRPRSGLANWGSRVCSSVLYRHHNDLIAKLNSLVLYRIAFLNLYRTRFLGHKFVSCGGPE